MTVAILTGGASRRMGRDKITMPLGDGTMIDLVVAACSGHSILSVGREVPGLTHIQDAVPGRMGPLAGLVAALEATEGPIVLVGADQPWIRSDTVDAIAALPGDLPVVPVASGARQVLCARYPTRVLDRARAVLTAGGGIRRLLDEVPLLEIDQSEWSRWGEDGRSWFSVDTPHDLERGIEAFGPPGGSPPSDE